MGRSPKRSSSYREKNYNNQQNKRRRHDSSSSESDNDRHRRNRSHQDKKRPSSSNFRVKQERDNGRPMNRGRRQTDEQKYEWGKPEEKVKSNEPPVEKEKPNFGLSGALLKDTNTYRGVVIKYSEPTEARKPKRRWRFYVFKGDQELPMYQIHRQSAYLIGRDRLVCDLPVDHPSCSKQHAVLQYRLMDFKRDDGAMGRRVVPYIIDLDSANGTFLNNQKIEARRYYELQENDVLKFGFSTREYVLLHEDSANQTETTNKNLYEDDGIEIKQEPKEHPVEST